MHNLLLKTITLQMTKYSVYFKIVHRRQKIPIKGMKILNFIMVKICAEVISQETDPNLALQMFTGDIITFLQHPVFCSSVQNISSSCHV